MEQRRIVDPVALMRKKKNGEGLKKKCSHFRRKPLIVMTSNNILCRLQHACKVGIVWKRHDSGGGGRACLTKCRVVVDAVLARSGSSEPANLRNQPCTSRTSFRQVGRSEKTKKEEPALTSAWVIVGVRKRGMYVYVLFISGKRTRVYSSSSKPRLPLTLTRQGKCVLALRTLLLHSTVHGHAPPTTATNSIWPPQRVPFGAETPPHTAKNTILHSLIGYIRHRQPFSVVLRTNGNNSWRGGGVN